MPSRYIRHSYDPPADLEAAKYDISSVLTLNLQRVIQSTHSTPVHSTGVYVGIAGRKRSHPGSNEKV